MTYQMDLYIPDNTDVIGFFADLHANDLNLMNFLKQNPGIKHWFSVGDSIDMAAPKHDNAPTLRIMRKFNIKSIKGNHEDFIIRSADIKKIIGDETDLIKFISDMPFTISIKFKNKIISLFHSMPFGVNQFLSPEARLDDYENAFQNINSDVIFIGHSHKQFIKNLSNKIVVNPGPLCDEKGYYCLINMDGNIDLRSLLV
jgi:predicted phosphodiesterase